MMCLDFPWKGAGVTASQAISSLTAQSVHEKEWAVCEPHSLVQPSTPKADSPHIKTSSDLLIL